VHHPICATCGVQAERAVETCPVCADERQYVGWQGQRWTTLPEMAAAGYRNRIEQIEPGLWGIGTEPGFAIGQRSLLVVTDAGNLLWDAISHLDDETVAGLDRLGGVQAISASHPHFYGSIVEWSRAFEAPIHLPAADREWIGRPDPAYEFYDDTAEPIPGLTLIRCGGHFEGSAVAHWPAGGGGTGALLTGDTIQVVQDRRFVSFMRSYPNLIPLDPARLRGILATIEPYRFDRIYGGWWGRNVLDGARAAVWSSAERYLRWASGTGG
jgi:glyoxylase-like metal-dependent hydrolase (beta-lactamase superfamily II)